MATLKVQDIIDRYGEAYQITSQLVYLDSRTGKLTPLDDAIPIVFEQAEVDRWLSTKRKKSKDGVVYRNGDQEERYKSLNAFMTAYDITNRGKAREVLAGAPMPKKRPPVFYDGIEYHSERDFMVKNSISNLATARKVLRGEWTLEQALAKKRGQA